MTSDYERHRGQHYQQHQVFEDEDSVYKRNSLNVFVDTWKFFKETELKEGAVWSERFPHAVSVMERDFTGIFPWHQLWGKYTEYG